MHGKYLLSDPAAPANGDINMVRIDDKRRLLIAGTVTATVDTSLLATAAKQDTLAAKFGSLGQKAMSGSAPVVIASDQSTLAVADSALTAKFGSLGQKASSGSAPVVLSSDQTAVAIKGTVTARQVLTASATLPAAGAYEAVPADGACVTIPAGSRSACISILYTRGAANGQAAHKFYTSNGTEVTQCTAMDGNYNGHNGAPSVSASAVAYNVTVSLISGETKIGIASAETGVTGTPGTYSTAITFG